MHVFSRTTHKELWRTDYEGDMLEQCATRTFPNPIWEMFRDMIWDEYWRRAWIRQEVIRAPNVVLWHGETQSDLEVWGNVMRWLAAVVKLPQPADMDDGT